jgi:hypothetical protein
MPFKNWNNVILEYLIVWKLKPLAYLD